MIGKVAGIAAAGLLLSSAAWAQDAPRAELSGFAGYSFNEGIDGPLGSNVYNSIRPDDQFTYGASLGYYATPNLEIGAGWSRQSTDLQLRGFSNGTGTGGTGTSGTTVADVTGGASPYNVGELDINNFHGLVSWNFGASDSAVRPFVFGGAGVTRYGDVDYTFTTPGTGGGAGTTTQGRIEGETKFSTTWGLGLKIAPTRGLGIRITGRWTPTRVSGEGFTGVGTGPGTETSDTNSGWWCSGFWGCYATDSQYAHQFSVSGGLTLRF